MNARLRLILLLAVCCLLFPAAGHARVKKAPIRVGICETPPFAFTDANGKTQGLYPDLINKIAAQEHWRVTFVSGTWTEGLDRLHQEKIDLLTHIAFSPKRSLAMDFSRESVFDEWGQVFFSPDNAIDTIADLEGLPIAVVAHDINGTNFIKTTESMGITCEIIPLPDKDEVFRAVQKGQAAAGVSSQHDGLRHAREFGLIASPIQFAPFSLYFAAKKGRQAHRLATIDTYIHRWKRSYNSYYNQRLSYWMGANAGYEKKFIPRWFGLALAAIAVISVLLAAHTKALDTTVKKRTQEVEARKKQYKDLVQSANSIILRMDKHGRILFLNRFGLELFGYTREEIYGRRVLDTILPAEAARAHPFSTPAKETFDFPERYKLVENESVCKDGRAVYIQWSNRAITDDEGHFSEILSIGTDITQRRQLEASLYQAQKMEAIGTLAGGIAHDFNNILTVIFGYTDLAKLHSDNPDKIREDLEQISQGGLRAKELVSQILTFSRKRESEKQSLQPLLIVKETVKLLRPSLPSTISIESALASKSTVKADPTQVHQIIMNLCTNAYHAMEQTGGTLHIALTDTHVAEEGPESGPLPPVPGDYIRLEVSDTGCGIEPDLMPKIFDPYFTTKANGKGTGLGLSVVLGIVREHKGHLHAESRPGTGSTFEVYLPLLTNNASAVSKQADPGQVAGGNETILVVDDEKKITDSLTEILSQHGYTVRAFADGKKALDFFRGAPQAVDLVLTDMTMPGMTGAELARAILALRPSLPVILSSGYGELMTLESSRQIGIAEFLQKPVRMSTLLEKIRAQLDD